ncbi:MAG: signal peptidase I [Candidatus Caenarcaniphilales bacterium]|jgi:signal peptidase I|nr:signal peptidase I [Candidatus Caenarcaniphilales bacterium]
MQALINILKAFIEGLAEGCRDLYDWKREPRQKPAKLSDKSFTAYLGNSEWQQWFIKETTAQIFVVLVLLILIREGIGEFRFIPSESMVPTMQIEDKLFVEKFSKLFQKQYQRGDIIIFYPPSEATKGEDVLKNDPFSVFCRLTGLPFLPQPEAYIKRVIGLPGDKIRIVRHQGVFINNHLLDEPYHYGSLDFLPEYDMEEIEIPQGQYFVLGDNRNYSFDSHYWGTVPKNRIIGRAAFLIYRPLKLKPNLE